MFEVFTVRAITLSLFIGRSKKKAFDDVKTKVLSMVVRWKMKALSQAGKSVLIRAVATAMPFYGMFTFLLPKGWCKEIDRILKDFWWGFSSVKKRYFTPKAWDSICQPKEMGGLEFRQMYEANVALIAKLG
ncbi:hypothetical protein CJ030_MR1G016584 [Morella rubra]|uniref:Uncharacterized protein n=1 Tax=Morella rubra TaxID=262757 RepID=A0A6A1W7B6_9ROSI|nr:hypothetical protein CJ030_MR3G017030 [Morella rubra]KAB1225202.1 hypothetical protein CJ030_MR1G016584 [Morella rubra]